MCDDDRGAAAQQRSHGPFHKLFGGRIQAGGRFIENDQPGIFEEHAREREQLRLTGRQRARADLGVQTVRQGLHPLHQTQRVEDLHDAGV